ncbi:MAG: hypothetical protein Q9216_001712 [Gyalolechia sp. 2 TL-2023]
MTTPNDDIIPRGYTLRHPIHDTSSFLKCTDRQAVLLALKYIDTERLHLERGYHRLTAENYYLGTRRPVMVPDKLLWPLDAESYTEERTQNMDLESLKNLALGLYMTNRITVQDQHRLRNDNVILKAFPVFKEQGTFSPEYHPAEAQIRW